MVPPSARVRSKMPQGGGRMGEAGSVAKKDHRRRTARARGGADARMGQGLEVRFCRGVIACFEVRV